MEMKRYLVLLPLSMMVLSGCNNTPNNSNSSDSEEKIPNPAIEVAEDGTAKPIYKFSPCNTGSYNPSISYIARFTVYVETDYDTDLDGKNDLVKAYVQLPKAILEKQYQIPSIFQASPYTASTTDGLYYQHLTGEGMLTDEQIKKAGSKREISEEIDLLTHVNTIDSKEFNYTVNKSTYYNESIENNYFLVRGFAYINVGGYGTYFSEGLETMGTRLETHAYSCIMDWLNGERVGFTDKNASHTIKATFSNGCYAVQGTSYLGTTSYQLACSNIKGLKTVVPCAGIASWYEYTNSQGVSTLPTLNVPWLSYYCNSKVFESDLSESYLNNYYDYLRYLEKEELDANGDYTDFWIDRDYTKNINPSCSALIIHGLNDFNVKPKQSILMYKAFKEAKQNTKMIFHQGSHFFLANGDYALSIDDYKESFYEVLNRWYSHYLFDIDNNIENYPEFTYQSNIDGKFYNDKLFDNYVDNILDLPTPSREVVTSLGQHYYNTTFKDSNYNINSDNCAVYDLGQLEEDKIIKGIPTLDINLKTSDINRNNLQVTAVLLDTNDVSFDAYGSIKFETDYKVHSDHSFKVMPGYPGYYLEFSTNKTTTKLISAATFDLYNPGKAPLSGCAAREELENNKSYNYQVNFEPTIYTVAKGHTLKLVLFTFDPGLMGKCGEFGKESEYAYTDLECLATVKKWSTTEPYSYTIDTSYQAKLNLPH